FYFFAAQSALLRWLPGLGVLLGAAAAGAWVADWRKRELDLLAGLLALTVGTTVILVVGARYRLPLVIPLALLGGLAIAHLATARDPRRIAVLCGIGIAVAIAANVWRHPPSHELSEEWALTAN